VISQTVPKIGLFRLTRKLILMGKAMEQQREPAWHAHQGYLKVVRLCLASGDGKLSSSLCRCLGDALLALGEYDDAEHVLNLTVAERQSVGGTRAKWFHNHTMCDNCIADGGSPKNYIQGFRFKCVTCAETDLCEKCFTARKRGLISANVRSCTAEHMYMKLPGPNWNREESAAAMRGRATPNLRRWLDGLRAKYQDGLPL